MAKYDSILGAVGNTPVVKLQKVVPPNSAEVYVKLEYFSPTGSYKDRMALAMIEEAEKRGDLRPGMTVVEYTGGSTGSSLAFVCAAKGYALKIVSSDGVAPRSGSHIRKSAPGSACFQIGSSSFPSRRIACPLTRAARICGILVHGVDQVALRRCKGRGPGCSGGRRVERKSSTRQRSSGGSPTERPPMA